MVQQTTIWKSRRDWLAGAQSAPAVGSQARPDLTRVKSGKKLLNNTLLKPHIPNHINPLPPVSHVLPPQARPFQGTSFFSAIRIRISIPYPITPIRMIPITTISVS